MTFYTHDYDQSIVRSTSEGRIADCMLEQQLYFPPLRVSTSQSPTFVDIQQTCTLTHIGLPALLFRKRKEIKTRGKNEVHRGNNLVEYFECSAYYAAKQETAKVILQIQKYLLAQNLVNQPILPYQRRRSLVSLCRCENA